MKFNKLVSILLIALVASCFLFGAVTPQQESNENDNLDTTPDSDGSDGGASGPSDLEQQDAQPATDSDNSNTTRVRSSTTSTTFLKNINNIRKALHINISFASKFIGFSITKLESAGTSTVFIM